MTKRTEFPKKLTFVQTPLAMTTVLKTTGRATALLFIFAVVAYALAHFVPQFPSGFLKTKPTDNVFWRVVFFTHVGLGATALALGPFQFWRKFRNRRMRLHRLLGKVYVFAILVGSVCAFGAAWFASTGWVAAVGFMGLATAWFYTTLRAYQAVRAKKLKAHEQWMYRSYAVTLSAVTLRIILPAEMAVLGLPFSTAYPIVAWLCWVPNLVFVEWWIRSLQWEKVQRGALA